MGRKNKKRINYKRLREEGRPKHDNVEIKYLEKAKNRRKLKVSIELSLKKLTRVININYQ